MKKRQNDDKSTQKRKKRKVSKPVEQKIERVKAEILNAQTLREGMVLLGCVINIKRNRIIVSLPGCLLGTIAATDISEQFTERIKCSAAEDSDEVTLDSVVQLGSVLPCKVLQVAEPQEKKKKPIISLSIDPKVVNAGLRLQSIYPKMVLHSSVISVEDHGYLMDIGVRNVQGFLPFSASNNNRNLTIGQIVPTSVKKMPSEKTGNVAWLSLLTFDEEFPEIDDVTVKLSSILPGTKVTAYVTEVSHPFIYLRCMNFDACVNALSLGDLNKNISEATRVSGTVLYIHPITNQIYLRLVQKPTPNNFQSLFPTKKFDLLKKLRYKYVWYNRLFFRTPSGTTGFVKQQEQQPVSEETLAKNPVLPQARVVFMHYMDNMLELSIKNSMLKLKMVKPEDIQVGDVFECTITKHIERGMFVQLQPGLSGFVNVVHFSDSVCTAPEKLHPVGGKIQCRVLSVGERLDLTSKESLVNLPATDILKSYEDAQAGHFYKGVVVHRTDQYMLILFFNGIKGSVLAEYIPESSVFYVGQTVTCQVLHCDPLKKRMKLSLLGDTSKKPGVKVSKKSLKKLDPQQLVQATIRSRNHQQLNLLLEGGQMGRVHISQMGSTEERDRPLRPFRVKQDLMVHCLGVFKNSNAVSRKRRHQYMECSLEYPPPAPVKRTYSPGMSIMAYVNEVSNISATLWLSPFQTATLKYLHYSENPKALRKLKNKLKKGMSLEVSIFELGEKSKGVYTDMTLTRLDSKVVEKGRNVVGFVEMADLEEGLVVQLPHGYSGSVCLTDLQDVYSQAQLMLRKFQRLHYILCHVIEVNHSTKNCVLSTRDSRLCGSQKKSTEEIQREITPQDVKHGEMVKGIVTFKSEHHLIVNIGRTVKGQLPLHACQLYECALCAQSKKIFQEYSPGDVMAAVFSDSRPVSKNLYPLSLVANQTLETTEQHRLKLQEDIDWNEE